MHALMTVFGEAFNEMDTYTRARPGAPYIDNLLGRADFFALAALEHGSVIGGLVAYELQKFEQERSEIYIYDLAVDAAHRRRGIATALIEELKKLAAERNAYVIFVQADPGDAPAIALYARFSTCTEALHFDIGIVPPAEQKNES